MARIYYPNKGRRNDDEGQACVSVRNASCPSSVLFLLSGLTPCRVLQQFCVYFRRWQLHISDDRAPDEAVPHRVLWQQSDDASAYI